MSEITQHQLDKAFDDGFAAAKAGFALDYCPMSLSGDERAEWQNGRNDWTKYGD